MTRLLLTLPVVPMAIAIVALVAPRVGTQTHKVPALVITTYNGGSPTHYATPKTPRGEPDLHVIPKTRTSV
jgi:hypothetical protein